MNKEKPFQVENEAHLQNLGTKYHKFYISGLSRPISKTLAKEGLSLKAVIIAVPKEVTQ